MSTRLFTTLLLVLISFIGFIYSNDSLWFVIAFFASMRYTFAPLIKHESKEDSIRERLKVMDDINGNPIYEGDRFTFEWIGIGSTNIYEFNGYFYWNQNELRYEVNILENSYYTCLYFNRDLMSKFKLIHKK